MFAFFRRVFIHTRARLGWVLMLFVCPWRIFLIMKKTHSLLPTFIHLFSRIMSFWTFPTQTQPATPLETLDFRLDVRRSNVSWWRVMAWQQRRWWCLWDSGLIWRWALKVEQPIMENLLPPPPRKPGPSQDHHHESQQFSPKSSEASPNKNSFCAVRVKACDKKMSCGFEDDWVPGDGVRC